MAVETILVVDDNEQNLMVAEGNLVASGYAVVTATDGREAVRLFKERTPELVLLDIMMPEMDGFETCRQMRALPQGADVPIVFLTSLRDLESHQKALDSGGDDVLTKPFNRTELLIRVRSMMWMKRLRSELRSGYNLISSQRDALIRTQRQKEELTNLIVHDLKNPLHLVIGCAQRLAKHKGPIEDAAPMELVRRITHAGKVMEQMVMNMLDINRSEDGQFAPKPSPVNLKELLEVVRCDMEIRAQERKVTVVAKSTLNPETIEVDPGVLQRLLENLLDNAIRYAPMSGEVQIELVTAGQNLDIRVRDQGRGIPAEHKEKIFEKYFRLDDETIIHNQGLGLTFCRLAAESHGGKIWVEDNQPKGAIFCVQIPFVKSAAAVN